MRPLEDSPFFALQPLNLLSYASTWPYAPNITTKRQHFWSSFRWHIQNFFGSGPQKHFLRNQPIRRLNDFCLTAYLPWICCMRVKHLHWLVLRSELRITVGWNFYENFLRLFNNSTRILTLKDAFFIGQIWTCVR